MFRPPRKTGRPSHSRGAGGRTSEAATSRRDNPVQRIRYQTKGGIVVERETAAQPYSPADTALADRIDERRGVLFSSSFEFPGRYSRWDMGFVDPPLVLTARGRRFWIEA